MDYGSQSRRKVISMTPAKRFILIAAVLLSCLVQIAAQEQRTSRTEGLIDRHKVFRRLKSGKKSDSGSRSSSGKKSSSKSGKKSQSGSKSSKSKGAKSAKGKGKGGGTPTVPAPNPPSPSPPSPSPPSGTLPPPTFAPGECLEGGITRDDYLIQELSRITDPSILLDSNTPQGQALIFLSVDDPLFPDVCTYPIEQRYSLLTLYYSTNGASWNNRAGWLDGSSECTWFGITCEGELVTEVDLGTFRVLSTPSVVRVDSRSPYSVNRE